MTDDYDNLSRELLIELVMAQKAEIRMHLEKIIELNEIIESYRNMRDTEVKPIIHVRQSKRKES